MRIGLSRNLAGRIAGRPTDFLNRLANRLRIAKNDLVDAHEKSKTAKAGMSVQERQEQLLAFYSNYEDFVEAMCDAAQYGPTQRLDSTYSAKRTWLVEQYIDLKPLLGAFQRREASEDDDAFESLFAAETVSEFLESDDGETIARITKTREALNLYGEHLRQLADRKG